MSTTTDPAPTAPNATADGGALLEAVLAAAESALGVPYKWGGNSLAAGVDCSGLVQQAFLAAGIRLPRVSASQMRVGQAVGSLEEAQPGDLIGYQNGGRNGEGVEHVAIYLGNGQQIEAYKTGEPVRVSAVRDGATFRRVLGHIDAGTPGAVRLGPNQDRSYTSAALGAGPAPEVQAAAVTAPPEGGLGDDLPENATPEQTEAYIRDRFPDLALLMGNDEIRYVLTWAVREDKAEADIIGALRQTDYFQTHSETSREVDLWLAREGPGSAEVGRITDAAKDIVSDLFTRNGIELDDPTLSSLAMQALRAGDITLQGQVMDPAGLSSLVAADLGRDLDEGLPAGEASFSADQLRQIARTEYLLPITQRQADEWAVQLLNGQTSEEAIRSQLNRQAAERYGWLGITEGQTTMSKLNGTIATVADLLEVDPDTIDLLDPGYKGLVEVYDEKAGGYRSATLPEAAQWARDKAMSMPFSQRPTWARQADSDITVNLARWAGKVA